MAVTKTKQDAQAAITRFNSFEKFTISSKPVTASYIHAGVFVPVFNMTPANERFTFSPIGNAATRLAYWDEDAYVSELVINIPDGKPAKTGETAIRSAVDKAAAAAEKEGLVAAGKETEAKARKRKADAADATKQKKTTPAHLQFWSNRHAELHGIKPATSEEDASDKPDSKDNPQPNSNNIENAPPTQSYSDPNKKCCYLCSRQFKTQAEVNKHERLSQLHRDNLQSEDLRNKALAKMEKAGISISKSSGDEDTPEYRDRAKERRLAFGAKKISLPMKKPQDPSSSATSANAAALTPNNDDENDAPPPPSKGASLLAKMGHKAGEGLGAQGTGMIAPIATEMYVQGVGLGAQGGKVGDAMKEAERNTRGGYGDWVERGKESQRERWEKLG